MNTLCERLKAHVAQMAPHQREREAGQLLADCSRVLPQLVEAIELTLQENAHLADGDVCTLIRLKRALAAAQKEDK